MGIISFLSIIAVLLALCTQYLFHPMRRIVTYQGVYNGDDNDDDQEMIQCPNCDHVFPLHQAIHPHDDSSNDNDDDNDKNKHGMGLVESAKMISSKNKQKQQNKLSDVD